jgi:hypothetical protein
MKGIEKGAKAPFFIVFDMGWVFQLTLFFINIGV